MCERFHLSDYDRGRVVGRLEAGQSVAKVARDLGVAKSVVFRLQKIAASRGTVVHLHGEGHKRSPTLRLSQYSTLMERRHRYSAPAEIAPDFNGLGECAPAVRKRGITGDAFLDLTEIKLATWKRDINLSNIRKLTTFVQDLNKDPSQYLLSENELSTGPTKAPPKNKKETLGHSLRGMLPTHRSESSSSHSSWGSDFEEDSEDVHPGNENGIKKGAADLVSGSLRTHPEALVPEPNIGKQVSPNSQERVRHPVTKLAIPDAFSSKPPVTATKPKVPAKFPDQLKSSTTTTNNNNINSTTSANTTTTTTTNRINNAHLKNSKSDEDTVISKASSIQPGEKKSLPSMPALRPSVPLRPSALTPSQPAPQEKCSLPKPPLNMQRSGDVQDLIGNLNFNGMCEEEYYDTYDGKTYPEVEITPNAMGNNIRSHIQNIGAKLPFPPIGPKPAISVPIQPTPLPQEEEYEVCSNISSSLSIENGYESGEEYESIKEHETKLAAYCMEGYLLPMSKPSQTHQKPLTPSPPTASPEPPARPPPLPAKPRPLLPDVVTCPAFGAPSPPKPHSEDSGSSGDGVTGRFSGLFRKKREVRERNPTPELKKTVTPPVPNHKPPPPPPVEQRSAPLSSTQGRPLPQPPVPDKTTGSGQRRTDAHPPLTSMPWYHNVERQTAERMLRNEIDGAFMIRPSTHAQNPLTLTLWCGGRLYNISVRQRPDTRYALGSEKANEQSFNSIEELVLNYQSEKLVLYSGGEQTGTTILTSTPRKENSK